MPVVRAIVFALLGILLVGKLVRACRTGAISSRGFTFAFDSSPLWFSFGIICYLFCFAFCVAEEFSVFGLVADPAVALKGYFTAWR
jgi:hypothetical protein